MTIIAHYTSIETAFAKIIPTQKLKLTKLKNTNDPYEANFERRVGKFTRGYGYRSEDIESTLKKRDEALNTIKKQVRIGCFSIAPEGEEKELECANNDHMWTHYANRKNGLDAGCAILFDIDKLKECCHKSDLNVIFFDKIDYFDDDTKPDRYSHDTKVHFSKKSINWKPESEYRLIVEGTTSDSGFSIKEHDDIFFDISGAIYGFVLSGFAMNDLTENFKQSARTICENSDLKFYRRTFSSFKFKHNITEAPLEI